MFLIVHAVIEFCLFYLYKSPPFIDIDIIYSNNLKKIFLAIYLKIIILEYYYERLFNNNILTISSILYAIIVVRYIFFF